METSTKVQAASGLGPGLMRIFRLTPASNHRPAGPAACRRHQSIANSSVAVHSARCRGTTWSWSSCRGNGGWLDDSTEPRSCPFCARGEARGERARWLSVGARADCRRSSGRDSCQVGCLAERGGASVGRSRQKRVEDRLLRRLQPEFPHEVGKATAAAGRPAPNLLEHVGEGEVRQLQA